MANGKSVAGSTPQWTPQVDVTAPSFQGDLQDALNRISQNVGALQSAQSGAAAQAQAQPYYDISGFISGKPSAGGVYRLAVVARSVTLAGSLYGSQLFAGTNPSAQVTLGVSMVRSSQTYPIGNITVTKTGVATFSGAGATLQPGDLVTLTAPSPQDSAFADISITLAGTVA